MTRTSKMHVTLHMAISVDGFIAKLDGDSDWVSAIDTKLFKSRCMNAGCIVLGRKTFKQFRGNLYPIQSISNIVLSHIPVPSDDPNLCFVRTPEEAIAKALSKGHSKILLAGGGQTNAVFLKNNLIDEIFLTVHPIILGHGIGLFGPNKTGCTLDLIDTSPLGEGLVQLHYSKSSKL